MVFVRNWPLFNFLFQHLQARKMSFIAQENVFTIFQKEKSFFQALKTKSPKSLEIEVLPQGLVHGFGQKFSIFLLYYFNYFQARKMSFTIFQNQKTPLQPIKTKSTKTRKIEIFPERSEHGYCQKLAIFPFFFFQDLQARKFAFIPRDNVFTIFQNQKRLF